MFSSSQLDAICRGLMADELASSLRHDLRNKLASVRNAAFFVQRKVATTEIWLAEPRISKFFQLIEDELTTADLLIGERTGAGSPQADTPTTSWIAVIESVIDASADALQHVSVQRSLSDVGLVSRQDDAAALVRCLLLNAAEASEPGRRVLVTAANDALNLLLSVSQTGSLSPDVERRAFEPLFTTKPGHGGLGLNVARRATDRLGGRLTLTQSGDQVVASARIPRGLR